MSRLWKLAEGEDTHVRPSQKQPTDVAVPTCWDGGRAGARACKTASDPDLEQGGNIDVVVRREPVAGGNDRRPRPRLVLFPEGTERPAKTR